MSRDFWFGMFAIPAAAVAVAIVFGAFVSFVWYSERFGFADWALWPKRARNGNQDVLASIVACARWARYLWVPGWHVVICRTRLASGRADRDHVRHLRVEVAVKTALREADAEREQ